MLNMNLDGLWEFALTEKKEDLPVYDSFACVPGSFDAVGLAFNERKTAHYRKKIMFGGRKRLRIGSFGLHAKIFLDGKYLTESYFAWSPLEVELAAEEGEHILEIKVDNYIKDHPLFIDRYDFYGFGGIFDHVTLSDTAEDEIKSIKLHTLDHTTGEIALQIDSSASFLAIAFDDGKEEIYPNTQNLTLKVPSFRLWSPEEPFLHKIRINEKVMEFGIRTLNWHGPHLLLNGKRVILKGVNRHESHPQFGAATPESLILSDLVRIKNAGFNFIRGSHYPQREFFFQCCDKLGLMVWEEPLSWGNWENELQNERFLDTLADQLVYTIRNSYNHPSLIIHGFLNECASDTDAGIAAVKRMMDICHREDKSRPASFATNRIRRDRCIDLVDIISMNVYPAWYGKEKLSEMRSVLDSYAADFANRGKPMVISEIGAAAIYGDHSEEPWTPWSEEYQAEYFCNTVSSVLENDLWDGFMLWLYCNANTYTDTEYKTGRPRSFNNKGLLDEYRRPKLAWKEVKKYLCSVKRK